MVAQIEMKQGQDSHSRPSKNLLILRTFFLSNASCPPSEWKKVVKKKVIVLIFLSAKDQQTFPASDQVVHISVFLGHMVNVIMTHLYHCRMT